MTKKDKQVPSYMQGDFLLYLMELMEKKKVVANTQIEQLAEVQNYKCSICNDALDNGEILEVHHEPDFKTWNLLKHEKKSVASGRTSKQAVHRVCHRQLHKIKRNPC